MSPTETSHASTAVAGRLAALGAECELGSCGRCGRALIDGATCACRARTRRARPRLSLVEALEGVGIARAGELGRLGCRGEVIA